VASPRVLDPVITRLKLPYTAQDLASRVTAASLDDTVLLTVTVQDPSPRRASAIANAIAIEFPLLVNRIETPAGQTRSPVKLSVTRPAVPAGEPDSPKPELYLLVGNILGFVLGALAAALRQALDRTIRSAEQAGALADAPLLGAISESRELGKDQTVVSARTSAQAEELRRLQTNIRFLSVDHRLTSFVVTGSLPQEGKTTVAANLAVALAQAGEQVVLVDGDLRRPSIAKAFSLSGASGLTNVLLGELAPNQAVQRWRDDLPLYVMASGPIPPNPSDLLGSPRFVEMVEHFTSGGTTVIVDSPPLLPVTDAAIIARSTDGALLVTRIGATKIEQLASSVDALRTVGATILGVIGNRLTATGTTTASAYPSRYPVTAAAAD
jgi:succinoglycan biosynthesis transport protein ExoP